MEADMFSAVKEGAFTDVNDQYFLKHTFADGVYCREMHIPAGHVVVGKIHKHEHINFISKGRVTVITELGGIEEHTAPCTLVSPAGVKRLLITHEDTIWSVVHVTQERDLKKIEDLVIAPSYDDYKTYLDTVDYQRALVEIGVDESKVCEIMESQPYTDKMPEGFEHIIVKPSKLSGLGVFTTKRVDSGAVIGPARIKETRTPLGRYANHSYTPNAEFRETPYGLESISLREIQEGEEILNDYRQGAKIWGASFNKQEQEKTLLLRSKGVII